MILYDRNKMKKGMRDRPVRTINLTIEEMPERKTYVFRTPKDKRKFIEKCKRTIRASMEYKELVKFLKYKMDMNRCTVLKGLDTSNGKKYRIELHHEPFSLDSIIEAVVNRRLAEGQPMSVFGISDEVMAIHYDGKVGLIPLSVTMHELVENDHVFIPLQFVYQDYVSFAKEYGDYLNPVIAERVDAKAELSLKSPDILSDCLGTEFVYVNIDGFDFPKVPDEWKDVFKTTADSSPLDED